MRHAVAALLALSLLAAGCGGDAADAQDTVSAAMTALSQGDADGVCDALTPAAERAVLRVLADNPLGFPDIDADDCAGAVGQLHGLLSQAQRNALVDGEVGDAELDGTTAKVRVIGFGMTAELEKVDGRWQITGGLFTPAGAD